MLFQRTLAHISRFVLFLLISLFFVGNYAIADISLPHDGKIRFYAYHVDEFLEIQYLDENHQWIESAHKKINFLLRSRGDNKVFPIDRRLIELADHLQDHFKIDTIEVICGYRSPEFNAKLKDEGHRVAGESKHMKGLAMDFHIDEINERAIFDYIASLKIGGVGYYGSNLMIHFQIGKLWSKVQNAFKENTGVGVFNKKIPVVIRTDKFFYAQKDKMTLFLDGVYENVEAQLKLQKFYRGKWVSVPLSRFAVKDERVQLTKTIKQGLILKSVLNKIDNMSIFGMFRWRYKDKGQWQNSNEFYVKKI